jgi:acyl-coenzyme A thioesterase PaaI-like protein
MLASTRAGAHPGCTFCAPGAPGWLALDLRDDGAGGVGAGFPCPPESEGYPGLVHGGVASGLLDAAMTNALFARGVVALTGRLTVRYRRPLRLGRAAAVGARVRELRSGWWIVEGTIAQDDEVAASAEGWFRERGAEAAFPGTEGD